MTPAVPAERRRYVLEAARRGVLTHPGEGVDGLKRAVRQARARVPDAPEHSRAYERVRRARDAAFAGTWGSGLTAVVKEAYFWAYHYADRYWNAPELVRLLQAWRDEALRRGVALPPFRWTEQARAPDPREALMRLVSFERTASPGALFSPVVLRP